MNAIDFFTAMNESLVSDIVGEIKSELVSIQEMTKESQEIMERRFNLHHGLFMGMSHRMSAVERSVIQLEKGIADAQAKSNEAVSRIEAAMLRLSDCVHQSLEAASQEIADAQAKSDEAVSRIEAAMLRLSDRVHQSLEAASQENRPEERPEQSVPKRVRHL
jgi:seryl-tRNA synthetase